MDCISVGLIYFVNWNDINSRLCYYYENVDLMDNLEIIINLYKKMGDI